MNVIAKLAILLALCALGQPVFASAEIEVDGGKGFQGQGNQTLLNFLRKYQISEPTVIGVDNMDGTVIINVISDIAGYTLRYGVYMLITDINTGIKDPQSNNSHMRADLIFQNKSDAQDFEKDLFATAPRASDFYMSNNNPPSFANQVIAVGYLIDGLTSDTVQFRHYFIKNYWGWHSWNDE